MSGPLAVAIVLAAGGGLLSPQPAPAQSHDYSQLAPLPTVMPPPPSHARMRWARVPYTTRARFTAASFTRGRAVVGLTEGADAQDVARSFGLRIATRLEELRAIVVEGAPLALERLAASADPGIRYVDPVARLVPAHRRNDPLTWQIDPKTGRPYEWAFHQVGVDQALNLAKGDSRILVGVVDTGVTDVPDLRGKVAGTFWDKANSKSAADDVGHGTFVSSIIAGRNDDGVGLAGFCGACRVAVFKAFPLDDVQLALGIQRLTDAHVRIINISVVFRTVSQDVIDALNYATRAGVLIVAASGNNGSGTVSFPASYLQPSNGETAPALSVGAVDATNARAGYSNWGSQLSLVAPGSLDKRCRSGIVGALPAVATDFEGDLTCESEIGKLGGNRYAYASGTSFAAPEVAGVAALVWSLKPELTAFQIASVLQSTATRPHDAEWTPQLGWGVVNARAAVELVAGKAATDELVLSNVRLQGARTPGTTLVARASATWGDGLPVVGGATPRCRVTVGERSVPTTPAIEPGVVVCRFRLGPESGGAPVSGTLSLSAPATPAATASFSLTGTG